MSRLVLGYGTLLLRGSLGHSIGDRSAKAKSAIPVIVTEYRRLFNLGPDHYEPSFKLSEEPIEKGALNVHPEVDFSFNALAFEVSDAELAILDERERYYQRTEVDLLHFDTREPLGRGQVYSAARDSRWVSHDPGELMPLWRDVVWSRSGAYRVGEEFGRFYDESTFLADGSTLVIDVYRQALEDVSDVELPD